MSPRARLAPIGPAVPVGYVHDRHATGSMTVWAPASTWAAEALRTGTLHAWAQGQEARDEFTGRGPVYVVAAPLEGPDGRERWAVRHYWRGGAMAMHMDDRYLRGRRARPFREILASESARARGVRTPAVIAGATYVDGVTYRCDLVTEVVPGVRPLADVLHAHDGTRGWLDAMASAGRLIRTLSDVGIFHVDLNAWNVLLDPAGGSPPWVIDLDRARVLRRPSSTIAERMKARLTRSVAKVGTPTGERLGHREIDAALGAGLARP